MNIVLDIKDKLTMLQDEFGEEEAPGEAENSEAGSEAEVQEQPDEGTDQMGE